MTHRHLHTALLLAGLLAGALLAGFQAAGGRPLQPGNDQGDVVARVDGRPITRTELDAVVDAIAREQPDSDTDTLRTAVLSRLIDEELLVQHALDSGLAERDRQVRSALVSAVMATRRAEAALKSLDEDQLRAFHAAHPQRFSPPESLWLRAVAIDPPDAMTKAAAIQQSLNQTPWEQLVRRPDTHPLPIPDAGLPVSKLANYIGARLAGIASGLDVGESRLFEDQQSVILLQVINRERRTPDFDDVREAVRSAMQREQAEQSLQALLAGLRESSDIQIDDAGQN